jgi:hypothetical protein
MREQRIGAILNNSSISGLVGIDGRAMYHAGKHGALGLTESAALDYAARVSASMRCAREVIDTPIVAGMLASQAEAMKELMKDVPIGRLGRPEEIAAAVLWLQTNPVTGRCEKIDFKIRSGLGLEKIALECPISDRWAVGKHLGSKIKSRKLKEINFFTSSRRNVTVTIIHQSIAFSHAVIVCHQDSDCLARRSSNQHIASETR